MTAMISQWRNCKERAGGAILLFRLGDFYEAFEEDASLIAKELELALTQRQGIPMAGIPAHTSETYIDRLVGKGFRVAIADQLEHPTKGNKGILRREITRIVTPGSLVNSSLLKGNSSNFILSLSYVEESYGLAILEMSTGDFRTMELKEEREVIDELTRFSPKELLLSEKSKLKLPDILIPSTRLKEEAFFHYRSAYDRLLRHFSLHSLDGWGFKGATAAICSAGALISYIQEELQLKVGHIKKMVLLQPSNYMLLDRAAQRHLELVQPLYEEGVTLLSIIDQTVTPMGGRLLKEWILRPLLSAKEIAQRAECVEELLLSPPSLKRALREVRDLERIIMRIETGYATARDCLALRSSLEQLPLLSQSLEKVGFPPIDSLLPLLELLKKALVDSPPLRIGEGAIFRKGYDPQLDALSQSKEERERWLSNYQEQLREETGIKTLKVGYSHPIGYYIEVSRGKSEQMPSSFYKKQTLVNGERFSSEQLLSFEQQIAQAEEELVSSEKRLFAQLLEEIAQHAESIRQAARSIAQLDIFLGWAEIAEEHNYVRPVVDNSSRLEIKAGRHPVIEQRRKKEFICNDTYFSPGERLQLITGPNMAGKSTFLRQSALIVLLAQIGSFVPADSAHIGIVDKLFTRIGANDDLSRGQSTFMVEMSETANILHHATDRSLIILDEIGRGTSTYDGIAIAWAVAEYLLSKNQAKTLFATHYFELTRLATEIPAVTNYYAAVEESREKISFLYKIMRGKADKSYAIQVAKIAGIPAQVIESAQHRLEQLQGKKKKSPKEIEFELFQPSHN